MKFFKKTNNADLTKDLTVWEKTRIILGFVKWVVIVAIVFYAGFATVEKSMELMTGTKVNVYVTHSSNGLLSPLAEAHK